jgi:DNA-binding MarR family transcriptional regulator
MTTRDLSVGVRVSDEFIAQNPNADPSATEVSMNVIATAELVLSRLEKLNVELGLTKGGFNVLQVVGGADEPLTPGEIAGRVLVRSATVTGIVDTLVRRKYVERRADPNDRRRVLVAITKEGRRAMKTANQYVIKADAELMGGLSEPERERLIRLLGKLQNHIRRLADS